jgi:hypothetical protein
MEFLNWLFADVQHFAGVALLMWLIGEIVEAIVKAARS